jgi:hypothetical protein
MKRFISIVVFIAMIVLPYYIEHQVRTYAQYHPTLYNVMIALDYTNFVNNGGGFFGYSNYFKWRYAKWINSPDRTIVERLLFWKWGIFYDATNPPNEYQYPLKV